MAGDRCGHDSMIVGFTTAYVISVVVSWNFVHGEMYSIILIPNPIVSLHNTCTYFLVYLVLLQIVLKMCH